MTASCQWLATSEVTITIRIKNITSDVWGGQVGSARGNIGERTATTIR
jgi:hypothetical protein